MNHLTTNEVFQIVDDTLANGVRTKLVAHIDACPKCRMEVELQRKIMRAAHTAPLVKPSRDITARVMATVDPSSRKTLVSRIVNNLGSIIAMAIVLTVVWYAGNTTGTPVSPKPTAFSEAAKTYVSFYGQARDFVSQQTARLAGGPKKATTSNGENVVLMTFLSIAILAAADRYIVRRFIRIRPGRT